jgi:hypothetical protein
MSVKGREGERILPTAIVERFTVRADGELEPLTEGSTKPIAQTVRHAGISKKHALQHAVNSLAGREAKLGGDLKAGDISPPGQPQYVRPALSKVSLSPNRDLLRLTQACPIRLADSLARSQRHLCWLPLVGA